LDRYIGFFIILDFRIVELGDLYIKY